MDRIFISLAVLFVFLLYETSVSQENTGGWEKNWVDASLCTAKPCNCSKKDRVEKETDCKEGYVLQVRGCSGDKCPYLGNTGSIRKSKCYNLNKLCPGWSDWMALEDCQCTTGYQAIVRKCNNPPPILEGLGCVKNDNEYALEDITESPCNCTDDRETSEETSEEATMGTTTTKTRYCRCKNSTDPSEYDGSREISFNTNTSGKGDSYSTSTTTLAPEPNPFGLNFNYEDFDYTNMCVCSEDETPGEGTTENPDSSTASNEQTPSE